MDFAIDQFDVTLPEINRSPKPRSQGNRQWNLSALITYAIICCRPKTYFAQRITGPSSRGQVIKQQGKTGGIANPFPPDLMRF